MRVGRCERLGRCDLGRLAVWVYERVRDRIARAPVRAGVSTAELAFYQACVRVQWGQSTEVVTNASNA